MSRHLHFATAAILLTVASAAAFAAGSHATSHDEATIGEPGHAARVSRTVNVDMTDTMRFTPADITVKQGETVRFVVRNKGQIKHELVLGTRQELKEHYDMMTKMPGMVHSDDKTVSVAPGYAGEIIWRFTEVGQVDFACLQPGHYDAGMKGLVTVTSAAPVPAT